MKESNLSPPVLAKNKGTVVFRLVPYPLGELSESVPQFQTYIVKKISMIFIVLSYPMRTLPVCFKYFSGIGVSNCQIMLMGLLPV